MMPQSGDSNKQKSDKHPGVWHLDLLKQYYETTVLCAHLVLMLALQHSACTSYLASLFSEPEIPVRTPSRFDGRPGKESPISRIFRA